MKRRFLSILVRCFIKIFWFPVLGLLVKKVQPHMELTFFSFFWGLFTWIILFEIVALFLRNILLLVHFPVLYLSMIFLTLQPL